MGLTMPDRKSPNTNIHEVDTQAAAEAEALRISKATQRAERALADLLEWVAKTDGRTAFLFAVNTALGGIALGALSLSSWSVAEVLIYSVYFILFAAVSFNLVMVQYPMVTSPNSSMVFFGTIAGKPFDNFVADFSSMTDDMYLRDVLHQCHVNARVVQTKFRRIRRSMFLLILSSLFWLPAIAVPSLTTPPARAFITSFFSPSIATQPNAPQVEAQPSTIEPRVE